MALALLLRGGRGAPLPTEFGRWVRYWWMALRLSTEAAGPKKAGAGTMRRRVTRGTPSFAG
jgi:hypothetical protein